MIGKFRHNGYLPLPITQNSVKNNASKLLAIPILLLLLVVYNYRGETEVREVYKLFVVAEDESHEIFPNSDPPNSASRNVRPIKFHEAMSDKCLDDWISMAIWSENCNDVDVAKFSTIDPVFPWVNGSDPVQISALQQFSDEKVDSQHRYQEHDELRYALRSIERSVGENVGRYHILASSYDSPEGEQQIAQHPSWLDHHDKVEMHHHYKFFQRMPTIEETKKLSPSELNTLNEKWRAESLPTFNSFAIEGQMHNIEAQSDTIVYHNDDFFTLRKNAVSDYYSPIHGPVLRSLSYSMYVPQEKPLGSRNGEGVAIARSSWILGKRFGMRWRPYIAHHARSLSLPILNEAAIMFDNSFNNVTLARFRNTKDAPWAIQSFFFASWFITERHREALLWSWIIAKWGKSGESINTDMMWKELTGGEAIQHVVHVPYRNTLKDDELEKTLEDAHIPKPLNTEYAFSSMDGFGPGYLRQIWHRLLSRHGWPDLRDGKKLKACTIVKDKCFKRGSSPNELFKHIAFEEYGDCGDCIITQLIAQAGGKGLEVFLPPKDDLMGFTNVPHLPLDDDWRGVDFSLNNVLHTEVSPRSFATRLIMRYNHVFGETPSQFTKVYNPSQLKHQLHLADTREETTFICLNDDVKKENDIPAINETDLRLHDAPALVKGLELKPEAFFPVWAWDPYFNFDCPVGPNRYKFLIETMNELDGKLNDMGNKLHVFRADPADLFPALFKQWNITHLVYEKDPAPYAVERDEKIKQIATDAKVEVLDITGHTLYDIDAVIEKNKGEPTTTAQGFKNLVKDMEIPRPTEGPTSMPKADNLKLEAITKEVKLFKPGHDINAEHRKGRMTVYDSVTGVKDTLAPPTLEELGYDVKEATTQIPGGEDEALRRLDKWIQDEDATATFRKPQTSPAEYDPPATTQLSPYIKFGALGVREFYWKVVDLMDQYDGETSSEPENLPGQLIFREMYFAAQLAIGKPFGQIRGNKICRLIDWKLRNVYDENGEQIIPRPKGPKEDEEALQKWADGFTGFPWIDAAMRQLKQEGWMHHLARHSVACFLTRGQLYISWERGAEVFDRYLVDRDPASNAGNWMWLSCSCFFHQYYRNYGTTTFPAKYDKTGKLVRKYVPELKDYPDKYIYKPWEAPEDVQKKAGCIIGKDYPKPMVDEKRASSECMAKMKDQYAKKLYGDSELKRKAN
ncbi:hypothetical protein E3Q22_02359 [Wallemia mellicola]|uniref:Photolyase/cryptochrome alpha/beta domain-containing protein n=1 Tax=Wallemia mellicola TaxID=1708541 RepID=A0A4T0Q2U7_9BASI|nr:hypothetical protein E3Q22_02359 [Wallemia mellicola]TIC17298.1 hypothetical protein E3Q13_02502 [Wallemia mellicola]